MVRSWLPWALAHPEAGHPLIAIDMARLLAISDEFGIEFVPPLS